MNGAGEDPTTLKRAEEYAQSIFRRAHAMRKSAGDVSGMEGVPESARAGTGQRRVGVVYLWHCEAMSVLILCADVLYSEG